MNNYKIRLTLIGLTALLLHGCGGGGGGGDGGNAAPSPAPVAPVTGTANASATLPTSGKVPWNLSTPLKVTLVDAGGQPVTTALSCSSADEALQVSADCSSVRGTRLGSRAFTVTSGATSAPVTLTVIPQPQPLAMNGGSQSSLGVVDAAGGMSMWGHNYYSYVGQGLRAQDRSALFLPALVKDAAGTGTLGGLVAAAVGNTAALALTESGEVWAWGTNNTDLVLGHGILSQVQLLPTKVADTTGAPLGHIVSVALGNANAAALADDGTVFSWGRYNGQTAVVGAGIATPGRVLGVNGQGVLSNIVAISGGYDWTAALTADGRVITWGYNYTDSFLGRDLHGASNLEVPLPGYVLRQSDGTPLTDIVAISAGYFVGLALDSRGQVYAWGSNDWGQAGQGHSGPPASMAVPVLGPDGVSGLVNVKMIAAGGMFALALTEAGEVLSWGEGSLGTLGDGTSRPRGNYSALPGPVLRAGNAGHFSGIAAIAAGYLNPVAIDESGQVWIWGTGLNGALGQGSTANTLSAVPIQLKDSSGNGTQSVGPISHWPNLTRHGR